MATHGAATRRNDIALQEVRDRHEMSPPSAMSPPHRAVLLILTAISLIITTHSPAFCADFIIISNPRPYSILNKYEQQLSPEDKARIVAGVPLLVVSANQTLGDGITAAMKTSLLGDVYFLLLDDNGNTIGDTKGALRNEYRNCSPAGDTITITRSGLITLTERNPAGGKTTPLVKGDRIIRILTSGSLFYAVRTGSPWQYGWCPLENRTAWSADKTAPTPETAIRPAARERIRSRFTRVNQTYTRYFDHFNTITSQGKSPPQWRLKETESEIVCSLDGGYNYASQLQESTSRLAQELANTLLGEPVEVRHADGEIRIRMKPAAP